MRSRDLQVSPEEYAHLRGQYPALDELVRLGIPVTRESYLRTILNGDVPADRLDAELEASLPPPLRAPSSAEAQSKLHELRPTENLRVYDLVREAGIDVKPWAQFKGTNPATNPKFCYDWAFVGANQTIVVCLWYPQMVERDGIISQTLNFRNRAKDIRKESNSSARAGRAERFDAALRLAAKSGSPIRVLVVDGMRRGFNGETQTKVRARKLDPVMWSVASYNYDTGDCTLVRGERPLRFADQYSNPGDVFPGRRTTVREEFVRSPEIRRRVLTRANGRCESCGKAGFLTQDGRIYLETHHVIPLSENGLDSETNVIALCPDEHREAHNGQRARELRARFEAILRPKP